MDLRANKTKQNNTSPITGGAKRETNPIPKIIIDRNPIPITEENNKISKGSANNFLQGDNKKNPRQIHKKSNVKAKNKLYK